jgi:hypothetical protein
MEYRSPYKFVSDNYEHEQFMLKHGFNPYPTYAQQPHTTAKDDSSIATAEAQRHSPCYSALNAARKHIRLLSFTDSSSADICLKLETSNVRKSNTNLNYTALS